MPPTHPAFPQAEEVAGRHCWEKRRGKIVLGWGPAFVFEKTKGSEAGRQLGGEEESTPC